MQTKGSDQEVNMLDETEEKREPDKANPIDCNLRLPLQGCVEFQLC